MLAALLYINSFAIVYFFLPRYHGSMIAKVAGVTWLVLATLLTTSPIVDFFKKRTMFPTLLAIIFGIAICHFIFIKFEISVDRMDLFFNRNNYQSLLKQSESIHQNNDEIRFLEIESRYINEKRFLLQYSKEPSTAIDITEIIKKYSNKSVDTSLADAPEIKKYCDIYMVKLCLFSC